MEDRDPIDSHNKHPDGCNAFKMDTNNTMLIKVNKETGADIVLYQVKVTLEESSMRMAESMMHSFDLSKMRPLLSPSL